VIYRDQARTIQCSERKIEEDKIKIRLRKNLRSGVRNNGQISMEGLKGRGLIETFGAYTDTFQSPF
jgi:hypothetical protein